MDGKEDPAMTLSVRPAAVAGTFYPEPAMRLASEVGDLLAAASPRTTATRPKAVIVPHAGYVYSGPIAASLYAMLAALRASVSRVVLLGPTHRVAVVGLALPDCRAFATPLGMIPVDQNAVAEIADLPQVVVSAAAHAQEHSLEVQLPFLQTVLGDFSLLPLAVGDTSPQAVAQVIERLWGGDETLIVVSSDLSHYLPYADARRIDAQTAQAIVDLDAAIDHRQACGATPINGLLLAARAHGLHAELLDLRNSGDTAGDRTRVVGYGAFAFGEAQRHVH
jgi:MEMO1 family protein